jgi:hypothetical protein
MIDDAEKVDLKIERGPWGCSGEKICFAESAGLAPARRSIFIFLVGTILQRLTKYGLTVVRYIVGSLLSLGSQWSLSPPAPIGYLIY